MKRIFAFVLAFCLLAGLVACSKKIAIPIKSGGSADKKLEETVETNQEGTFGEWVVVKEASCTENGLKERTGKGGAKETEVIPALGHDLQNDVCTRCGAKASVGLKYWLDEAKDVYYVTGIGTCTDTDLILPATYQDKPVKFIAWEAFRDCNSLTNITIPNSVTSIGLCAFMDCTGLTGIIIPDSVTDIDDSAFFGCESLNVLTVANGNPKYHSAGNCIIETASKTLIAGCKTSVIPSDGSVTSIFANAFNACAGLTSVTIPSCVTSIGKFAFANCTSLASITVTEGNPVYHSAGNCIIETASKTLIAGCKTSVIPTDGSVTAIGDWAFYWCTGLTSITIPGSISTIGGWAFSDCRNLSSLTIRDGVTSIGRNAFENCSSLARVTIPSSVDYIGDGAFSECVHLTSVTIPEGVTTIGSRAFAYCEGLTGIVIPKSVDYLGSEAFYNCERLTTVYYTGTKEEWSQILNYGNDTLTKANIVYNYQG